MLDPSADTATPASYTEPRWPPVLTLMAAAILVNSLPSRYTLAPPWVPWFAFTIVSVPMIAVALDPKSVTWHRAERGIIFLFSGMTIMMVAVALVGLITDMMASNHHYSSITLLESAVFIWTLNILAFSLLYWQFDRGGPESLASGEERAWDFHFGEYGEAGPEGPRRGWVPRFVDYLFLAFATSTSFTPPDYARPSSRRAKLLVIVQASVSLTTLVLIASRAVATIS